MGISQVSALPGGWGKELESLLPCTQEAHPRSAQGASVPRYSQLPLPNPGIGDGTSGSPTQPRTQTQEQAAEISAHQKLACRKQERDPRMWAEHSPRASEGAEPRSQSLGQPLWPPCHL